MKTKNQILAIIHNTAMKKGVEELREKKRELWTCSTVWWLGGEEVGRGRRGYRGNTWRWKNKINTNTKKENIVRGERRLIHKKKCQSQSEKVPGEDRTEYNDRSIA